MTTLHCYRCWVRDRVLTTWNLTLHQGTALCLSCVDEIKSEERESLAAMMAAMSSVGYSPRPDDMTVGDLLAGRWTRTQRRAHRDARQNQD